MASPQGSGGHLLDQVCAKLARAQQHGATYAEAMTEWAESVPYGFREKYDPKTGWHTWTFAELKPMPAQISLYFGDFLTALRSTLDYLAQALVRANKRIPRRQVAFPILTDRDQWDNERTKNSVHGIGARWVAELERLQPYHGGEDAGKQPLAILNRLANRDKHRLLQFFSALTTEVNFTISTRDDYPGGGRIEHVMLPEGTRFEHGTEFARIRTVPPYKLDVDVDRRFGSAVKLVNPGPLVEGEDFPDLFAEVQRVISIFLPAFD